MRKSHLDSRPTTSERGRGSGRVVLPPRKGFATVVDRGSSTAPTVAATSAYNAATAPGASRDLDQEDTGALPHPGGGSRRNRSIRSAASRALCPSHTAGTCRSGIRKSPQCRIR